MPEQLTAAHWCVPVLQYWFAAHCVLLLQPVEHMLPMQKGAEEQHSESKSQSPPAERHDGAAVPHIVIGLVGWSTHPPLQHSLPLLHPSPSTRQDAHALPLQTPEQHPESPDPAQLPPLERQLTQTPWHKPEEHCEPNEQAAPFAR